MDLGGTCIVMFTLNLTDIFGIMAHPANQIVKIKYLFEFSD